MKRIISEMLAVLLCVLILAGCGQVTDESPSSKAESGTDLSTEEDSGEASVSEDSTENSESEDDLQQREALFEELNEHYLPLYGILINCEEWDSPEEIGVNGFYIWYTQYIIANTTAEERFEWYSGNSESVCWAFPAEEFEGFVQQYFNISTDFLRSSDTYIPEYNWYDIGGSERWLPNYSIFVASPEDISISGNTATAKLTCASNLDSSVVYFYLSLDISEETYRFTGCRVEDDITPCTTEETLEFIETGEAKEQAASYIEWMGATSFSGEKDFIEGNISTLLGWFEDEIYAAAEEDSYNEREQYLLIPFEIAKKCLYRHFGVYDFDPSDYFYSPETDSYIVHKEHENPRYEVISMKVVSVSENVIEFENVFSDGYHDEGESHYLASYTTMEALKDGDTLFLRLTNSYADKNLRFATPEEAEASLKNQFR